MAIRQPRTLDFEVRWDPEARVFVAISEDVDYGFATEAATLDALRTRVQLVAEDLCWDGADAGPAVETRLSLRPPYGQTEAAE